MSIKILSKEELIDKILQLAVENKDLNEANELYDKHWNAEKQSSAKAWLENKWLKEGIELALDYLPECPNKAEGFLKGVLKGEVNE